jgi:FixJ family two-component response regulator
MDCAEVGGNGKGKTEMTIIKTGPASATETEVDPVVLVVEDDELVRTSIDGLLRSAGYRVVAYPSASEFLESKIPETVCCLITDVRLPRVSGLDLQDELARRGQNIPIIFMTGHGDIPMTVRAMKAGAVDFLSKPFRDQDMLDAVTTALEADRKQRKSDGELEGHRARFATLTSREKEVLQLVASGLLNKQAAGELGLSEITVKLHRASMMKKMEARTLAQLMRIVEALERSSVQG